MMLSCYEFIIFKFAENALLKILPYRPVLNLNIVNGFVGFCRLWHKMHCVLFMKGKVIYLKMVNSIKSDLLFALAEYCLGPLTYNYLRKLPGFDSREEKRKKMKTSCLTCFNAGKKELCAAESNSFILGL